MIVIMGAVSYNMLDNKSEVFFNDNDLGWWATAMASGGESGGGAASLKCQGVGYCNAKCGICQVDMTATGHNIISFTCRCN